MANHIVFQEVTEISGIDYVGSSHGAAWADFNGDSYPDLWVTNHYEELGRLYLNSGEGTFTNITTEVFFSEPNGDQHGAAWADFDNDGDQDLLQLLGGGRGIGIDANQLYINQEGKLENQASELGLDYPFSRGRNPLWFDFDKDGWLDIFLGAASRPDGLAPPSIFRQTDNGFENARETTGFDFSFSLFGLLSDLTGDHNLEAIFSFFQDNASRLIVYDTNKIPLEDVTSSPIGDAIGVYDVTAGDFNNDLRPDLYLTRYQVVSDLVQEDARTVKARIINQENVQGFSFEGGGNVTLDLSINSLPTLFPQIYIGAGGFNPDSLKFSLSAENPDVEGIFPHTSGEDRGIYIGYDSTQQSWQVLVSSPHKIDLRAAIETSEAIANLTAIGFDPDLKANEEQLLLNTDEGFIDYSQQAGINNEAISGNNVVSGDFDNDMDLDLYIVATGTAGNHPNILYENQGNGTFVALSNAGGAEGTNLGIGDSVTTADYNLDGFLDLFVTNGDASVNLTTDAPYQLFQNQGNDNNWLEIDLEGTNSNRDGIGTQVFVTAGGVTQLREQSGGIHHRSQNHSRLHFGLADNTRVEEISIKWTNGQEQKIYDVAANQLLHIIEPSDSLTNQNPSVFPLDDQLQEQSERELIDLRHLTGKVKVQFQILKDANYDHAIGFYTVENERGEIRDPLTGALLSPGDTQYVDVALKNSLSLHLDSNSQNNISTQLEGGVILAPYLAVNGTVEEFLASSSPETTDSEPQIYFAYSSANPDSVDHLRLLGDNTFGFEDLYGGGDFDYNDLIVRVAIE